MPALALALVCPHDLETLQASYPHTQELEPPANRPEARVGYRTPDPSKSNSPNSRCPDTYTDPPASRLYYYVPIPPPTPLRHLFRQSRPIPPVPTPLFVAQNAPQIPQIACAAFADRQGDVVLNFTLWFGAVVRELRWGGSNRCVCARCEGCQYLRSYS
ncbi:hypothetical protein DENSPDRAFT_881169 [Dentipellis sp. KUC8613]|nr:hypothetical protein DENSPDRAFT_881169 [Dentipellis sp. KUC8613]